MHREIQISLEQPVTNLPSIGTYYAARLKRLGIETVYDLVSHFPTRYEDFSLITPIISAQPGETVTVRGQLLEIKNAITRYGKLLQLAKISDHSGVLKVVWFNQGYLVRVLKIGQELSLAGKVDWFGRSIALIAPEYELVNTDGQIHQTLHTGRLVPIYPETEGLSSKWLRGKVAYLLANLGTLPEHLPETIMEEHRLLPLDVALREVHFPSSKEMAAFARRRLSFDELLLLQLTSAINKRQWQEEVTGRQLSIAAFKNEISKFWESLPFTLTRAQRRAVSDIFQDLAKSTPMNRLLAGDVGSGKTVVATIAMYVATLNGWQSALMAPTEILAEQHYQTIQKLLAPLGITVELKTSSTKRLTSRKSAPTSTRTSVDKQKLDADIIIGTHALLSDKLEFDRLGLVVVDEQHRFGVEQRYKLGKKGNSPHLLTMTATPIPRSVALILYGELDVSYLDELPEGRKAVKTWVVPDSKRAAAYEWIRKQSGRVFIICPLIEESGHETMQSVKAATKEFSSLEKVFPDLRLGLLHGRLKSKDKTAVLNLFRTGGLDVLVATPVVEVGVDIPEATIMVIEGAERFGLAQLHQLRGRVGRGDKQAYCLLFTSSTDSKVLKRLKHLERHQLGIELAELDLKLRGPGEILGKRQHGRENLKIATFSDLALIRETREVATKLLKRWAIGAKATPLQEWLQRSKISNIVLN